MDFVEEDSKKIIEHLSECCDKYGIHEFHIHKAILYMVRYLKQCPIQSTKNHIRQLKIIASICVGLSMKFYEKEPINFYHLQEIFGYLALMKEMNDLERNILAANHFQLFSHSIDSCLQQASDLKDQFKFTKFKRSYLIAESSEGRIYATTDKNIAIKIYDPLPLEYGISVGALSDLVFQNEFDDDQIITSKGISYENNKFGNAMQLCNFDFSVLIQQLNPLLLSNPNSYFDIIKHILHNITKAVKYIHDFNVVHYDLKPQNILITDSKSNVLGERWKVKISDFGAARSQFFNNTRLKFNPELECCICTLWYRPIDVLLGNSICDNKADIWSLGCIFAEAALGRPLFAADTEVDMIKQIFSVFGNPSPLDKTILLPYFSQFSCKAYTNKFHKLPIPNDLKKLISSMLTYDPNTRPDINEVLDTPYFS